MNFKNFVVTVMVLVGFFVVSNPVFAQRPGDEYIVQLDDNLWELAGDKLGDPNVWERLVDANPFLQEPGRRFQHGDKIVVLLHPGERLRGLEAILQPYNITVDPLPFSALKAATPPMTFDTYHRPDPPQPWWTYQTFSVDDVIRTTATGVSLLTVLIGLAVAARLIQLAYRRRDALRLNAWHPVFQGSPMQPGWRGALAIPASIAEHVRTITRMAGENTRGLLTEIVAVEVRGGRVPTEYRDGNREAHPTGETLYLGVFRQDGVVTKVTGHWRACLNGLLYDQMSSESLLNFVQTATWSNPRRFASIGGFNPPFDFAPIRSWLEQSATDRVMGTRPSTEAPAAAVATPSMTPVPTATTAPSLLVPQVDVDPTGTLISVGGQRIMVPASLRVQIQRGTITIGATGKASASETTAPAPDPMAPPPPSSEEHPTNPGNGVGVRMQLE